MKPIVIEDNNGLSFALVAENGYVNPIVHVCNLGVIRVVGYTLHDHEKVRAIKNAIESYPNRREELINLALDNQLNCVKL